MQSILQNIKRLTVLCLITLFLVTSSLTILSAPARADENTAIANEQKLVCLPIDKEMLVHEKGSVERIFQTEDLEALGTIAGISSAAAAAHLGSITVATITAAAPGIAGWVGMTATTVVALPVAGVVAAGGILGYGGYKVVKFLQDQDGQTQNPCLSQS
jgi:hypothetical protein